jgi:hypothetical protein
MQKQTKIQKNRKHSQTKRQRGGDTTKTINGTPIDSSEVVITDLQGNSRSYDAYMKHAEDMDRQGTR